MKTYIIGCEGTARNIIEQVTHAHKKYGNGLSLDGIIIDSYPVGSVISGIPVVGGLAYIPELLKHSENRFIFALFKPDKMMERHELLNSLAIPAECFVNFIHPDSYVAESAKMGTGNVILTNCTVQSNVEIGNNNIINSNVVIEHESVIGDANFIAAGAVIGSKVHIGQHCFIGLNSSVREEVKLGNGVFIAMHSVVLTDIEQGMLIGKELKKR